MKSFEAKNEENGEENIKAEVLEYYYYTDLDSWQLKEVLI